MKKIIFMLIAVMLVVGIVAATTATAQAAEIPATEPAAVPGITLRFVDATGNDNLVQQIINTALRLVTLVVTAVVSYHVVPFINSTAIPWLKEKRLYSTVRKFVQAAEKMGETGAIPKEEKKAYVVAMLQSKGINVTTEVEAFIESAVTELDHMASEIIGILGDAVDDDEADEEDPEPEQELKPPDTEA